MDQDPGKGGTEKDGSKSSKYCSYCYKDGEFVGDFKSAQEMVDFVKGTLKEQGMGPIRQWFFTMMIPSLERWKDK